MRDVTINYAYIMAGVYLYSDHISPDVIFFNYHTIWLWKESPAHGVQRGDAHLIFMNVAFLPFRQLEGLLKGLYRYIPEIKAADYTTIFKRLKKMNIEFPFQELDDDIILAIDSTGMKVSSRGEWIRHKWKVKKGWIKVHVAVDIKTKKLLALEITDESVGMKNVATIDKTG